MASTYIPQYLFSGLIRRVHTLEGKEMPPFYQFNRDDIVMEAKGLDQLLTQFPQDEGTVVVWFVMEESIPKKHTYSLLSELDSLLSDVIDSEKWELIIQLIPGQTPYKGTEMLMEAERLVHQLAVKYPFDIFAQIVGFGHPIPFQTLFLEGVRQFENRYASVYWENNQVEILHTTIKQTMDSWMAEFRNFIIDHDYQAALEIITDIEQTKVVQGIKCLLQMMVDRFNFSFDLALAHVKEAKSHLPNHDVMNTTEAILMRLLSQNQAEQDLARIQELFRQIDVFIEIDDMPSFLVRFYRVREAILYYLFQHGRTSNDSSGHKNITKGHFLEKLAKLDEQYLSGEVDGNYGAYFYIKSANVTNTLEARNKSFLGHSRKQVNTSGVWKSYNGMKSSPYQAKLRFTIDSKIMMRDLGIEEDENIPQINKYLLQVSSQMEKQVVPNG
ncbi:hypothetical protein [Ornithinibacillus halotolerans]|uniref:Uncharacterized protein n=1 Tax=Ornithinibacillus halotolerans TaxID=1274357 RepID=A0A916SBZ7_9BACI|nr:hypothetical protein [Ornithinibacillus halotolerans]GGA92054.1 hypothetical protein GCM10008025_38120 [Ornithinibacillus halotolerans]